VKRVLLALTSERASAAADFDEVFLWADGPHSSFSTSLSSTLCDLGSVTDLNVDFVRLAMAVYAADRSIRRQGQGSDWNQRVIHVTVPVTNSAAWQSVSIQLSQTIGFLTGDRWSFDFEAAAVPDIQTSLLTDTSQRCVLLSGGADSATGALLSQQQLAEGQGHTLISHYSQTKLKPIQKKVVARIAELVPDRQQKYHQIRLLRASKRLDGSKFQNEPSTRSRSLLFLALGLASASSTRVALWIPENGFASLNPPLGPERRGSLTTKTTHPKFISDLSALLRDVGAHGEIINPFGLMTKGEMFRAVAEQFGRQAASEYLSATNSCAHTDSRFDHGGPGTSCGVCFGCIVRRASFRAADLPDLTPYLSVDPQHRFTSYVEGKSVEVAMRDFVSRGVSRQMVWSMDLSTGYSARQAYELCERGIAELGEYLG
jgi:7-cyano-7-deazaguanine synthase in queuosine biosynthesis